MNTFEKLERLTELAKKDETLCKALLKTRENKEPILSFCALAREAGVELYPGELLAVGTRCTWATCSPPGRSTATTSARAQTAATLRRMTLLTMLMRFSWRLLEYEEKV